MSETGAIGADYFHNACDSCARPFKREGSVYCGSCVSKRLEQAEARLARVVGALGDLLLWMDPPDEEQSAHDSWLDAKAALAAARGER